MMKSESSSKNETIDPLVVMLRDATRNALIANHIGLDHFEEIHNRKKT